MGSTTTGNTKDNGGKRRGSTSRKKSTTSGGQSRQSKKRWHTPEDVRQFAAQANKVATMILNGEIDIETARAYSSLARVVSQSASIQVTKARFLKEEPDLNLDGS